MKLSIPYHWTDIELSVKQDNSLELTFSSDTQCKQHLIQQIYYSMGRDDFIEAIGTDEMEKLIGHYSWNEESS